MQQVHEPTVTIKPRTLVCEHYEDIKARWKDLSSLASGITPTRIGLDADPDEIRAVNDDLLLLARKVDALIASYGQYVAAYTSTRIDQTLFTEQLLGALDGNAMFEVTNAADELQEDIMDGAA